MELIIGGAYNWVGQPERLIYIGKAGLWYQFSLVGASPHYVWCEVPFGDLIMFEKLRKTTLENSMENNYKDNEFALKVRNPKMSEDALRDEFAGKAMQSFTASLFIDDLSAAVLPSAEKCASIAYVFADAMMKERIK